MSQPSRLRRGEWRIVDTPEGWRLQLRHHLSPLAYLMATSRRGLFLFPIALATFVALTWVEPSSWPIVALGCLALLWLTWFYGKMRPNFVDANRQQDLAFAGQNVELPTGVFKLSLLRSLRHESAHAVAGRVALVFDGTFETDVELIGWPGVAPSVAESIAAAVRQRVDQLPGVLTNGST